MALIGYARVSTDDQTLHSQRDALKAAGCGEIHEEQASGGDRRRPVLARVLDRLGKGDSLVVVRIDRLARSLAHLLEVMAEIEAKGAHFRSLEDPIHTERSQDKFALQVLGAAAELERALIRERTKAGLASARLRGRVGGNPGLKTGDRLALRKLALAREEAYLRRLGDSATQWVPHVRRLRPDMPWQDVVRVINAQLHPLAPKWTQARLVRAVKTYVENGFLPDTILERSQRAPQDDRLPAIVAALKGADPEMTLQAICQRLEAMRERTPRGQAKWYPSSAKMLVDRAKRLGLLPRD